MEAKTEAVKVAADTVTGVTIGEATDTNGLVITLVTIIGRLALELIINRRMKKQRQKEMQNKGNL